MKLRGKVEVLVAEAQVVEVVVQGLVVKVQAVEVVAQG